MTGDATGGGLAMSGGRPEPWGPEETVFLIDAYEERWRASRRGQLRAQQWEEVAAAVAVRMGHPPGSPRAKSGTQCRHKLEKLRQRYRSEVSQSRPSTWLLFPRMHRLERSPLQPSPPSSSSSEEDDDDKVNGAGDEVNGVGDWLIPRVSRSPRFFKKRPVGFDQHHDDDDDDGDVDEDDDDDVHEEEEEEGGGVVGAVRGFGEGLMRLERRRMEVMRELERERMEMEARRTEMVVEASRCLAEAIAGAFSAAAHRAKRPRGP